MDKYCDRNILLRSASFIFNKVINDPNYNFFNDATAKAEFETEWNHLVSNQIDDEEHFLENNRTKLVFLVYNYHVLVPGKHFNKLSKCYLYSEQFYLDFDRLSSLSGILFDALYQTFTGPTDSNPAICRCIGQLYNLSLIMAMPLVPTTYPILESSSEMIPFSRIMKFYFELNPKVTLINDDYINRLIHRFVVDKALLGKWGTIHQTNEKQILQEMDELQFSRYICSNILLPIQSILLKKFNYAEVLNASELYVDVSEFSIRVRKSRGYLKVPIEIQESDISIAFNNQDSVKWKHIMNRILYVMLAYKSKLGFVIGVDCLLIVQIDETPDLFRLDGTQAYSINCHTRCIKNDDMKYSIPLLLIIFLVDYFQNVKESDQNSMSLLFNNLKRDGTDYISEDLQTTMII
ncbi:hypothetical protein DFJ63DRAFT_334697 [Scheffersomyces coipomensis]|uniref:uncharacterized protein n=1 Tax=Scheffersomyces coipomensis TaxID=1788519 RepID=UPI00315CA43A